MEKEAQDHKVSGRASVQIQIWLVPKLSKCKPYLVYCLPKTIRRVSYSTAIFSQYFLWNHISYYLIFIERLFM